VGFGGIQVTTLSTTIVSAPRHRLGMANATLFIMVDVCASVGPVIVGILIPLVGYVWVYLIGAIFTALSFPVYWRLIGRKLRQDRRYNT